MYMLYEGKEFLSLINRAHVSIIASVLTFDQ